MKTAFTREQWAELQALNAGYAEKLARNEAHEAHLLTTTRGPMKVIDAKTEESLRRQGFDVELARLKFSDPLRWRELVRLKRGYDPEIARQMRLSTKPENP